MTSTTRVAVDARGVRRRRLYWFGTVSSGGAGRLMEIAVKFMMPPECVKRVTHR